MDTVIASVFRYMLCLGLTTHLYDPAKRSLVYFRAGHCYSLLVHWALAAAYLIPFIMFLNDANWSYSPLRSLYRNIMMLIEIVQYVSAFTCIFLQWTLRSNVANLFDDIIWISHKVTARFQGTRGMKRRAATLLFFKAVTSSLIVVSELFEIHDLMVKNSMFIAALHTLSCILTNILLAVMFLFASGLVFSLYIFETLNHDLGRVVGEIGRLRASQGPPSAMRHRVMSLERDLSDIGCIHAKLRKWVVQFKGMYQIELLLSLLLMFLSVVFVAFLVVVYVRAGRLTTMMGLIFASFLGTSLYAVDVVYLLYISGELLDASHSAGVIIKDLLLPESELPFAELQKSVELVCFQLKTERLSLRLCGMFDLNWSNTFAVAEAVFLYIMILVQWDYQRI